MAHVVFRDRTVQYWRLVDARDSKRITPDVDWDAFLRSLYGKRTAYTVNGRELSATVKALEVDPGWLQGLSVSGLDGAKPRGDEGVTYGLVLAGAKDYVPNQEDTKSGVQQAMGLAGSEWAPVDNLFVWFLPFGNMFAVLAESVSSSRAASFADWLNAAGKGKTKDDEFAWAAVPVIDASRAAVLSRAQGLRSFTFAGKFGSTVKNASGLGTLFSGKGLHEPSAIRIEIKASLVRGSSSIDDQAALLEWFSQNFGGLQGAVDKAQVVVSVNQDDPPNEVDLLHHRLTRKTTIRLGGGQVSAFSTLSVLEAMVKTFLVDRLDLIRLRGSDD